VKEVVTKETSPQSTATLNETSKPNVPSNEDVGSHKNKMKDLKVEIKKIKSQLQVRRKEFMELRSKIRQLREHIKMEKVAGKKRQSTTQNEKTKSSETKPTTTTTSTRVLDARFVKHVTCEDGTTFGPDVVFHKVWRLRNDGSEPWPSDTVLLRVSQKTNELNAPDSVVVGSVSPGETIDVVVPMRTPKLSGEYFNHWKLFTHKDGGRKFGQRIRCLIRVVVSSSSSSASPSSSEDEISEKDQKTTTTTTTTPNLPMESNLPVQSTNTEQPLQSTKWTTELNLLIKLGFNCRKRLIKLLEKYNGNVNEVLEFLVTRKRKKAGVVLSQNENNNNNNNNNPK
jgi:hypothetical protein